MTIIEAPKESQSALTPVLFDPEGEVLTTNRLNVFVDEGRPMLNNYFRHVQVGWGQHGDVYLCHKVNVSLPVGHPERRIPVVRALSLIIIILFHNLIYQLISFFFFFAKKPKAMKSVKRNNPRAEQMRNLRRQRLPASAHLPVADRLNTTEAKIKKEIAIMKKLRHPHVVRLYEVIDDRMKEKIYMSTYFFFLFWFLQPYNISIC